MLDQFCCRYHYVSSPFFTAWERKRKKKEKGKYGGGFHETVMNFTADILDFLFTEIGGCRTKLQKHL